MIANGIVLYQNWLKPGNFPEVNIVTPTPNEAANKIPSDWLTYKDEKGGIEFKYPPKWVIRESSDQDYVYFDDPTIPPEEEFNPVMMISVNDNPLKLEFEEYYDGNPGYDYFSPNGVLSALQGTSIDDQTQRLIIHGHQVMAICPAVTFIGGCTLITSFESHFFIIDTATGYGDTEKQIIESLKTKEEF